MIRLKIQQLIYKRKIREAIYIKRQRLILNRDCGYELSTIFNHLSRDNTDRLLLMKILRCLGIRKLLNFRNANHSSENYRNFAGKVEFKENFRKKCSKIWVFFAKLSSFLEILENAVRLATRKLPKFQPRCFS